MKWVTTRRVGPTFHWVNCGCRVVTSLQISILQRETKIADGFSHRSKVSHAKGYIWLTTYISSPQLATENSIFCFELFIENN